MIDSELRNKVENILYNAGVDDDGDDTRLTDATIEMMNLIKIHLDEELDVFVRGVLA